MKQLRYTFRIVQAFVARFKAVILISIIVGILFFLVFSLLLSTRMAAKKEVIGTVGRYTANDLPSGIKSLISNGLTRVESDGTVVPDIAKSWETPDGGKTWIFQLDTTRKWHDGNVISAKDISYEFKDAAVTKIDDETIQFELENPFSAFPVIVSKPIFKKGLNGTGEWEVKDITLTGGYINRLILVDKKGNKKIYKFFPNEERLRSGFILGEIDVIENLQNPEPFDSWKTVNISADMGSNNIVVLFFNTQSEMFAEKTIRQAYTYAINKDNFPGERAIGPISPSSWAYNSQVKLYEKDTSKSTEAKDTTVKLFTLPNLLNTAERIVSDLKAAGVNAEVAVTTSVPQEDYQLFLATIDIPKDPDQYVLWHSTQTSTNISKYNNPRIDKLLEDGRSELDMESRKKIYLDFQRFIVEDVPAVFLYHPTLYRIERK